jgi:Tfp pilus assembly protein PilN
MMPNHVDFLPQEVRKARVLSRLMNLAVLGSLVLMVGVAAMGFVVRKSNAGFEDKTDALRAQVDSMRHWENELVPLKRSLEATAARHSVLQKLYTESNWVASLGELSESIPENAVLNYFHLASHANRSGAEIGADTQQVHMTGVAKSEIDLLMFIDSLERTRYLNEIEIEKSGIRRNSKGEQNVTFQMHGTIH